MNILFLHQNMPGQFRHLAPALARDPAHRVVFLTRREDGELPGVRRVVYRPHRLAHASTHHYLRLYENSVLHGQEVVRAGQALLRDGFRPDLVIAHPGWGEALFLRDIFPRAVLLNYCEFYYHGRGADVGFDPDSPADLDSICRARARNAHLLLSLESCDHGLSPTHWQRDQHPEGLRQKISVIFDGVDTAAIRPDPAARFTLPDGTVLTRDDEVVTYAARNLEPYRGFPSFMRALPTILAARPRARVVIVGGDEVSYGQSAPDGQSWRDRMLAEVGPLDPARVHMLGLLGHRDFLSLLQISSVHVYLTVPFVLSWSCMEALSAGCLVVGSRTAPVQEVIEHGRNGLLADFRDPADIATRVIQALEDQAGLAPLRARARATVVARYELRDCLAAQLRLVRGLV